MVENFLFFRIYIKHKITFYKETKFFSKFYNFILQIYKIHFVYLYMHFLLLHEYTQYSNRPTIIFKLKKIAK